MYEYTLAAIGGSTASPSCTSLSAYIHIIWLERNNEQQTCDEEIGSYNRLILADHIFISFL
jgi:hypothetical protein